MLFQGIIERNDEEYGYCKVRIFGKHNSDKTILPTDDLPNAKIMYSGESNIDEISYFRTFENGTWVICDFLDPDEQVPVILGSVCKDVETLPDFTKGFTDENSTYPSVIGENTISRLARNENISSTIVQTKITDRETGIACVDETFDEPENEYNTTYPNNRVLQTKKHIIEIDDTDGSERIHIYHNSGTFEEINPDGTKIEKIKGDKFLSVEDDLNIVVHGKCNIKSDDEINIEGTNINLNGSDDNLIAFTDMQTAFNLLRTELNNLISAYNTHIHTTTATIGSSGTPGVISPTVSQGVSAIADMSSAILNTLFTP